MLNCTESYSGAESKKAYIFLDSDIRAKPSKLSITKMILWKLKLDLSDLIKDQLRSKNSKIFEYGMVFKPKSKKLIEKEFLIELFLFESNFENLKMAFKNCEQTKKEKWSFINTSKAQTRLIEWVKVWLASNHL